MKIPSAVKEVTSVYGHCEAFPLPEGVDLEEIRDLSREPPNHRSQAIQILELAENGGVDGYENAIHKIILLLEKYFD